MLAIELYPTKAKKQRLPNEECLKSSQGPIVLKKAVGFKQHYRTSITDLLPPWCSRRRVPATPPRRVVFVAWSESWNPGHVHREHEAVLETVQHRAQEEELRKIGPGQMSEHDPRFVVGPSFEPEVERACF